MLQPRCLPICCRHVRPGHGSMRLHPAAASSSQPAQLRPRPTSDPGQLPGSEVPHGTQGGPEVAAILPPCAFNDDIAQLEHIRPPLLLQRGGKGEKCVK